MLSLRTPMLPVFLGDHLKYYFPGPLCGRAGTGMQVCDSALCLIHHRGHNKSLRTGWLQQLEFSLTVLEARIPKSRCRFGWFLLEALRQIPFHAFLPTSGCLAILGVPWLTDALPRSLPLSARDIPSSFCVSLGLSFLFSGHHPYWI